jgi:hypothetical protein
MRIQDIETVFLTSASDSYKQEFAQLAWYFDTVHE